MAGSKTNGQLRFGAWVDHVGCWIRVETIAFMNFAALKRQRFGVVSDLGRGCEAGLLNVAFATLWKLVAIF